MAEPSLREKFLPPACFCRLTIDPVPMTEEPKSGPPVLFLRPTPILFGAVAGFGMAILLQQFAVTPLTTMFLLAMTLMGMLVIGIALPTALAHGRAQGGDRERSRGAPRITAFSLVALLTIVALVVAVMGAQAQQSGEQDGCSAAINGERSQDRVEVPESGVIEWSLTSHDGNIASWEIMLHYAWLTFPLDVGLDLPPETATKNGTEDLNDYPRYGVGVYRLSGTVHDEHGGTCTGTVDVVVPGNPLLTPLGLAALVLTTVGVVGGSVSANNATRGERGPRGHMPRDDETFDHEPHDQPPEER